MARNEVFLGFTCKVDECLTCGIPIAIPLSVFEQQRKCGGYHWCANGHKQGWSTEDSEEGLIKKERDDLLRERDRLKQRTAQLEDEAHENLEIALRNERSANAYKGQVTKLKKRSKAGVCPCCNRIFKQLAAHMKNKHPDFDPEAPLQVIEGGAA